MEGGAKGKCFLATNSVATVHFGTITHLFFEVAMVIVFSLG